MTSQARRALATATALTAAAAAGAPSAGADGLPISGIDARPVSSPGVEGREDLARRAKPDTVFLEREIAGERVLRRLRLSGKLAVPAVAYDGSPSGLSADGRTLVLIEPRRRFPRPDTTFAVIDATRMKPRGKVRLGATSASTRSRPTAARCT